MAMREIAIVKKTGEQLVVDNKFIIKKMKLSFEMPKGMEMDIIDMPDQEFSYKDKNPKIGEGANYILSDGNTYNEDELIVGLDNIREYKISKINE